MTDTGKRKDLIYPTSDTPKLSVAQFDSDSTSSPSHETNQLNGIVPDQSTPIQIGVENGFSSEEDSEDSEVNITLSRSCGQAELKKLKSQDASPTKSGNYLSGKYIELPNDEHLTVDDRVQSTYTLFTKGRSLPRKMVSGVTKVNQSPIKSMGTESLRRRSPSPSNTQSKQSSPSHTSLLQPSSASINIRCTSPEVGKRIKSNPFFIQDRKSVSQSNMSQDRKRLDSAPAKVNLKVSPETNNKSDTETSQDKSEPRRSTYTSSPSKELQGQSNSSTDSPTRRPLDSSVSVNIQSRIKLWADKEKEAKETREQEKLERLRSPISQKNQSSVKEESSNAVTDETQTKSTKLNNVVKVLKNADFSEIDSNDQSVKLTKQFSQDVYSSSSSLGTCSPSRSPAKDSPSRLSSKDSKNSSSDQASEISPKRSRWKIRSPLFSRKKTSASESASVDSEQSDDNMLYRLTGSDEKLSPSKKDSKEKASGKLSRTSKKRKAIKKRFSSSFGMVRANSDSIPTDDQVLPSNELMAHELRQRSNSVGPKSQRMTISQPRAVSQPDISKLCVNPPSDEDYMTISFMQLDAETEKIVASPLPNGISSAQIKDSESVQADLPSGFLREKKGRTSADANCRTISRDIRDIINSLGTDSLDRNESDSIVSSQVVEEAVEAPVFESILEQAPLPDPSLNIVVQPPADEGMLSSQAVPHNSDSEEESYLPRGGTVKDCSPIMSSLDSGSRKRALIKRRLSDSSNAFHSTKLSSPKGPHHPRTGSLSPTDDSSDGVIATSLMYADAVWDRVALEDDELSFNVGDAIEILDMTDDVWWYGSVDSINGWFPASFVRLRIGQDSDEDNDSVISTDTPSTPHSSQETPPPPQPSTEPPEVQTTEKPSDDQVGELPSMARRHPSRQHSGSVHRRMTIRRKDSAPSLPRKLTSAEVRAKVIEEIINTERDYVRHLEDIIEGYVKRCRGYNKLFDEEMVETIFSNVEAVYTFQKDFLRELEASINNDRMEDTQIGQVFVNNRHEFDIYGQYCNNHPHAVNEMNKLQENEQYTFFFESCRLLRNLQDISLEGFLLTPVQKICKYPLQLTELLKYTSEDHPDHQQVVAARDAMREVAMHINEMKRRMENIGKIGCWQETIDGWKGEDILGTSSQMLRCGELHKISKGRSQERHFFLFDHQLIYCKKDTIGGKLTFKGRVYLDQCQITDIDDGTAMHSGSIVKNAWRMNNKAKDNKWYTIFAKTPEEKRDWMEAFRKERELVKEDQQKNFHVSLKMKRAAVALCANASKMRRGRRKSSTTPMKNRVALVESVDSGTRHKISSHKAETGSSNTLGRKLAVSIGASQMKGKTNSKKKRTS